MPILINIPVFFLALPLPMFVGLFSDSEKPGYYPPHIYLLNQLTDSFSVAGSPNHSLQRPPYHLRTPFPLLPFSLPQKPLHDILSSLSHVLGHQALPRLCLFGTLPPAMPLAGTLKLPATADGAARPPPRPLSPSTAKASVPGERGEEGKGALERRLCLS